jgi:hypothetical protein
MQLPVYRKVPATVFVLYEVVMEKLKITNIASENSGNN